MSTDGTMVLSVVEPIWAKSHQVFVALVAVARYWNQFHESVVVCNRGQRRPRAFRVSEVLTLDVCPTTGFNPRAGLYPS